MHWALVYVGGENRIFGWVGSICVRRRECLCRGKMGENKERNTKKDERQKFSVIFHLSEALNREDHRGLFPLHFFFFFHFFFVKPC